MICWAGYLIAFFSIDRAILSYSSSYLMLAHASAIPHPTTIPSSIADLVAFNASSILYFLFLSSISVDAHTLMTPIPPTNFDRRCWVFSRSYHDWLFSIPLSILARSSMLSLVHAQSTIMVVFSVATILVAHPNCSGWVSSSFIPSSSVMSVAHVTVAISFNISDLWSPNPGDLIITALNTQLILLSSTLASASGSISLHIISSWSFCSLSSFSINGFSCLKLLMIISATNTAGLLMWHSWFSRLM